MQFKASDLPAAIGSLLAAALAVGGLLYFMVREIERPGGPMPQPTSTAVSVPPPTVLNGAGTVVRASPEESPGGIIRCEVAGKVVYSNAPCGKNAREVDVFVNQGFESPPASVPMVIPRSPAVETAAVAIPDTVASEEAVGVERCRWIEQAIKDNEATARQPQTPQMQDWLTAEKRKLLDEKVALKC